MFWILLKWFGTFWIFFEVLILFSLEWIVFSFGMIWNVLDFLGMICFFLNDLDLFRMIFFNYLFLEWFVFWGIICNDLDLGTFGLVFLWIFPDCIVFYWFSCFLFLKVFECFGSLLGLFWGVFWKFSQVSRC